jgi:hypothetical protein
MQNIPVFLKAMAVITLVSCSSSSVKIPSYDDLLKIQTEQNGRACIRQHNIRGYGVLEDDVLSINARGKNKYYIATTWLRCDSISTSFAAGFKGDFSEVCGGGRDSILTSEQSCSIKSIFEFSSREEALMYFKKAKETRQSLREKANKEVQEK